MKIAILLFVLLNCNVYAQFVDKSTLLKYARKRASQNITAATARGLSAETLKSFSRRRASSNVTAATARGLDEVGYRTRLETNNFDPHVIEIIGRFHFSREDLLDFLNPIKPK